MATQKLVVPTSVLLAQAKQAAAQPTAPAQPTAQQPTPAPVTAPTVPAPVLAQLTAQVQALIVPAGPSAPLMALSSKPYSPQYKAALPLTSQHRNYFSWQLVAAMLGAGACTLPTLRAVLAAGPHAHHCFVGWRNGQGNFAQAAPGSAPASASAIANAIASPLHAMAQARGNNNLLPGAPVPQAS